MRTAVRRLLLLALAMVAGVGPAIAEPVEVALGSEIRKLQDLVDQRYGRGRIDVRRDFIGARPGDQDPWFWVGDRLGIVRVTMVQENPDVKVAGWYLENGAQPLLPPANGSLFIGHTRPRDEAMIILPGANARFGFYIEVEEGASPDGRGGTRRFFTNRSCNTSWAVGQGTIGPPFAGRVQALIFDVSRWVGHDAWLVCFEDMDAAGTVTISNGGEAPIAPGGGSGGARVADNDFDDVVIEVSTEASTLARAMSFGTLKLIYR